MKTLKYVDWCLQTVLLILGILNAIFNTKNFIYSYFIVGTGNVISCIVHAWLGYNREKGAPRSNYQRLLLLLLVIGALLFFAALAEFTGILFFLMVLLLISPVMALFYYWITWTETAALLKEEKTATYESI